MEEKQSGTREQGVQVPLEFHFPPETISRYATHMLVQHTDHEFIVSFFEIENPVLLGSDEARQEKLQHLDTVRAHCVARVIVAPERMHRFIAAMQENLENYISEKAGES